METKTIVASDIRMTWLEEGTGYPVVFVHGIPTSPALWRHVIPRLRTERCIAWEMVGYGSSRVQGRGRDISVARQADYLATFLDTIGVTRAVFAGHDLGGGVVQNLAVRRPDLCAGMMLTNAICYDSWPIPSVKAMQMASSVVRRLPAAALASILRMMYFRGHDTGTQAQEAMRHHWPMYASRFGPDAFARQIDSLNVRDTLDITGQLPKLAVPAHIVWGAADQFQKLHYGERLASDLNAPLHIIPGAKHFTPEDHPDTIADAICAVIKQVAPAYPNQGATPWQTHPNTSTTM
ncbi:alpha/beta fold hydrolase [Massilia psychrophila]|uniref:Oxidoreductase n=1 Tax=Massilia psychrophila TaxID=1603353 RepID=A0A2G8SWD8_9BURK|nr:alpha/beta hydrolase [Massilia psychrophila]PIL38099.1 oxidoreductase [Massilia psychrophila]GGE88185.1 oxidoreductase [Massilia psychrophila]